MAPFINKVAPYVKVRRKQGQTYYYYLMPDGGLEALGKNRKIAIDTAAILTISLRVEGDLIEKTLTKRPKREAAQNPTFSEVIQEFIDNSLSVELKEGILGAKTYKLKLMVAKEYQKALGAIYIQDITTFILTSHLKDRTGNVQVKHIALLNKIFKYAIGGCGYRETNPVTQMIPRKPAKRKRKRHTIEGLKTIHEASPTWFQNV